MNPPFRVVVFSGGSPEDIRRLIERIHDGAPEARVCGLVVERRPGKSRGARMRAFVRNLRQWDFVRYASGRIADAARDQAARLGESLLHLAHGGRPAAVSEEDFESFCRRVGCAVHVTTDYHGAEALDFVRARKPDLGLVYGTRILKPCLFTIPKHGSINIHKRKVPDYRGGGPVGLWELLDGAPEIGVTVHEVTAALDAGAVVNEATIPIEPFDNLTSLALKAHVVGNDLLVRSVADFARGTVSRRRQEGEGRMFKAPSPTQLARHERTLLRRRPGYRPFRSRPAVKLVLKTLLGAPAVVARNWRHRRRGSYPVTILFHHLVADRPHRMGLSTEHFSRHVQFLQRFYRVVSLQEAIGMLRRNEVTAPTVVLTFDDGYRDNFVNVRAVVEKTRVPITWYVSTDHVTEERPFQHDLDAGFPGFLPLTWAHVRQMHAEGFEIGSHTKTHFDCGSDSPTRLHDEIVGSKKELEARLCSPVATFSFPFGLPENISSPAAQLAARTYDYVLSAFGGDNAPGGDVKHLKRWAHPSDIWELELVIQGQLEREQGDGLPHAAFDAAAASAVPLEA